MANKFVIGDHVRHIGGTAEGLVTDSDGSAFYREFIWVRWDKTEFSALTRIDSLELAPAPTPCAPKPHPWDRDRAKIACSDHIFVEEWNEPRLVVVVSGDSIFYVDNLGYITQLKKHRVITRVERVGAHGWEEVGND